MRRYHPILSLLIPFFMACSEAPKENGNESQQETEQIKAQVEAPADTTPVTVVYLKILGKENMIRGAFTEGQTIDEFIESSVRNKEFEKLVNVDIKGSPFAEQEDEEGFEEDETGAVERKMSVYDILYMEDEDVEQPFRVSVVTKVKDYETWKWLYDMEAKDRKNAGMKQLQLGVNHDDPNEVFMLIAIEDIAKAREMMHHPGLEAKMEESGVIGKPVVKFWRPAGPQSEEL